MTKRVMLIAGEPSGDLHGSGVVRELLSLRPGLDVFGVGGDNMKREGMDIVYHISRLSFMGFIEVVKNLGVVRELERRLDHLLDERKPDVVVLIDYPGFNLRFARRAREHGIKVLYYISPQVWAWHRSRLKAMRTLIDRMKVVFPFEVPIYEEEGIDVEFVGHPLAERIGSSLTRQMFCERHGIDPGRKILALLPGSRRQELENILPVMIAASRQVRESVDCDVAIGVAPNLGGDVVRAIAGPVDGIRLIEEGTYDLMAHADAAIVTSGTATLETGWFGTPMAVVYKTSPVTYVIGRALIGVPYIGLVNIVAGEKVVPEFVQHDMTAANLAREMKRQLTDDEYAGSLRRKLSVIKSKLGGPGASKRVAQGILELGEKA